MPDNPWAFWPVTVTGGITVAALVGLWKWSVKRIRTLRRSTENKAISSPHQKHLGWLEIPFFVLGCTGIAGLA